MPPILGILVDHSIPSICVLMSHSDEIKVAVGLHKLGQQFHPDGRVDLLRCFAFNQGFHGITRDKFLQNQADLATDLAIFVNPHRYLEGPGAFESGGESPIKPSFFDPLVGSCLAGVVTLAKVCGRIVLIPVEVKVEGVENFRNKLVFRVTQVAFN